MSRLTGDWKEGRKRFGKLAKLTHANIKAATARNAVLVRDQIKRTIRNGRSEWPALSPLTIGAKGSSKPLIDNNDLMQGVSSIRIGPLSFFVGIPLNKGLLVTIATSQEFGATIKPRKAKSLAIPVSREAKELSRRHGGTRNIPGLFRPKGTMVLAISKGKTFEIMFILSQEIVIPPRPFIEPSFADARHRVKREWEWAVISALRGKKYVRRS